MAPHSKRKNRSKALTKATGFSPYPLSETLEKAGSDALSASRKYASDALSLSSDMFSFGKDKAKKNTRSIIKKTKKAIKSSTNELQKSMYEPKIKLSLRTIFMSLRDLINENWLLSEIPRYTFAKALETFMKKYDSSETRPLIGTSEIMEIKHILELPHQIMGNEHPALNFFRDIFRDDSDLSNIDKVVDLLERLFKDHIEREEQYKSMVAPDTSLEMGQGWAQARVNTSHREFMRVARENTLVKLNANLEKQKTFLDNPKIKPSPPMLFEMNKLQKEALSIVDEYKNMTDLTEEDIEIVQFLNDYVFPLMKKYPELESYNKGSSKRKSKATKSKAKKPKGKKSKGKRGKKRTSRRNF